MKSWRSRIAAGAAVSAALVAIPLTAGTASAADWHLAGGFGTHERCMAEGQAYIDEGKGEHSHPYTEFECRSVDGGWQVWVR